MKFIKAVLLGLVISFFQNTPILSQTQKPNIIFILGDDIGYKALRCNGGNRFETPFLDTMSQNGMRFNQCQGSPRCSPSRSMLLSGKYNFRNYIDWGFYDTAMSNLTFANLLKGEGYQTACFGKWQFGGGDASIKAMGFDRYCVTEPFTPVTNDPKYRSPKLYANGATMADSLTLGKYGDDIMTDSIIEFITDNKDNPFLLFYPTILSHYPFQPTPIDSVYNTWYQQGKTSDTLFFPSMMKYMDMKIGQIINKVKELGIQNNTIIFFVGDNGTPLGILESSGPESNYGGKGGTNSSGTHVPLLVLWPETIQPGTTNNELIDFTDFFPTFAELTGSALPTNASNLDGHSFANDLKNLVGNHREWIFDYYHFKVGKTPLERWVHTSEYKLYDKLGIFKFYNLKIDSTEKNPLPDSVLSPLELQIKSDLKNVLDNYASISRPVLTNAFVRNISDTSVELGARILPIGGFSSVLERGSTYFSNLQPAASCAFLPNKSVEGGTSVSTFSHVRTDFLPQSNNTTNCFATNNFGSGFSTNIMFRTLSKRVMSSCSNFTDTSGPTFINLNWSAAEFPKTGATKGGYLIVYSQDSLPLLAASPNGKDPTQAVLRGSILLSSSTILPQTPKTSTTLTNLKIGDVYNFLLVPFTWDGSMSNTYNYDLNGIQRLTASARASIFTWVGGSNTLWSDALNWSPKFVPSNGDSIQFTLPQLTTVSNVPNITLSKLLIKGSGAVTLMTNLVGQIEINGLENSQFIIDSGSQLILGGIKPITIKLASKNNAIIKGIFKMQGAAHRLICSDALAVNFNANSIFVAGDSTVKGFSGSPFGNTGEDSCVSFLDSSSYIQYEGLSPFGLASPLFKTLFSNRSNFYYRNGGNTAPQMSGRRYGNLFIENNTSATTSGSSNFYVNTVSVDSGSSFTYTGSGTNTITINGDIISKGNLPITIASGTGGIYFSSGANQYIGSGEGTGQIFLNNIIVSAGTSVYLQRNVVSSLKALVNGSLYCGTNILSGSGSFTLSSAATLGIGSIQGLSSQGSVGNIQTATRIFNSSANYVFNAIEDQVSGLFNTTPKINTVNSITISSSGKVTCLSNFITQSITTSPYSLTLKSGRLDLNGFNFTVPVNGLINGLGGQFVNTNGNLIFAGMGTVVGDVNFSNVVISKSVDLGSSANIASTLQINAGGLLINNSPAYSSNSSLVYNTSGNYKRGLEWSAVSGKGYPFNVVIINNTLLDLSANGFEDRYIAGNLILGGNFSSGSLTMGAMPNSLSVRGNVEIGSNTGLSKLTLSSAQGGNLYIGGNWIRNSTGLFSGNTKGVFLNGILNQNISANGPETFANFRISKPSGNVVLGSNLTITSNLTFSIGNEASMITDTNILFISNGAVGTISKLGGGYIVGNCRRNISVGSNLSYLYPIGTQNGYTPVTVNFTNVTSPGYLSAASFDNDHPLLPININRNNSVNRYWSLGSNSIVFSTYKARFTFLSSDKDSGLNTGQNIVGRYSDSTWKYPTVSIRNQLYTEISDETSFGDFAIGQLETGMPIKTYIVPITQNRIFLNRIKFKNITRSTNPFAYNGLFFNASSNEYIF